MRRQKKREKMQKRLTEKDRKTENIKDTATYFYKQIHYIIHVKRF